MRKLYELEDGESILVNVTGEGLIVDLIKGGEVIGSWARTADELADGLSEPAGSDLEE